MRQCDSDWMQNGSEERGTPLSPPPLNSALEWVSILPSLSVLCHSHSSQVQDKIDTRIYVVREVPDSWERPRVVTRTGKVMLHKQLSVFSCWHRESGYQPWELTSLFCLGEDRKPCHRKPSVWGCGRPPLISFPLSPLLSSGIF